MSENYEDYVMKLQEKNVPTLELAACAAFLNPSQHAHCSNEGSSSEWLGEYSQFRCTGIKTRKRATAVVAGGQGS